ncbi:MAG TPA: HAMP domain-containing sensor histidine kinase [Solirubrobacteraceae bacterium]|nr:HAMP domain-containing sensor histidine kinase [Solirubrobacteraceae bacterium]
MKLIPRSLRARLVLAAGGSIVAAVALFGVAAVLLVRNELQSSLDSALRQRALQVAELAVSAPAVLTAPGALESPVSGRQIVVEVLDSRGRILARSLALGANLLPEGTLAERAIRDGAVGYEDIEIDDSPYRLYAAPIAQGSGAASGGAVLVASQTTDIAHTIGHLGLVVTLSGAGAALLAILAAIVLTGTGLRPLRRLAVAGEEIERTADPSRRLPETDSGDELAQLTGVLNRMLGALERSRENERRFLADASHELRTPVTSLRGNVEYIARHGASPDVIADLERDAARLARLVDDLLVLERVEAVAQEPRPVELDSLLTSVLANHNADGRLRRGTVEAVAVDGDSEALARALENLVENALVHGPDGGAVTVALRRQGSWAALSVSDEGPGPTPGERERVFERFWRGPATAARPGSGLGLSIVAAIVERHRGRVSVEGSTFLIELPARAVDRAAGE